jgi:Arc/MetJ-type ribon-helix-helix transcriptional regulator
MEVVMVQAKFSLDESHIEFLEQCKQYGFKDKSEVVRTALNRLYGELAQQRLQESAELYTQVYADDDEIQEWTEAAVSEWPT